MKTKKPTSIPSHNTRTSDLESIDVTQLDVVTGGAGCPCGCGMANCNMRMGGRTAFARR